MNKRIKKIIALTIALSAVISTLPEKFTGMDIKVAYAASYTAKSGELTSLVVKSTNKDKLSLKDGYNGDTVKLSDDKEYYVKLTDDSEGVVINADAKGDDRVVRIFLSDDSDAKAYKPGDTLYLGKGNTTIYVRTYASLSDFRKAKDKDKDVSNCEEEYKVYVKKTQGSDYEDSSQDSVYLKDLSLSKGNITFIKQRTTYNIKVDSSVSEIKITAKPEDDNTRVRIDGDLVDDDDNYKKTVSLSNGKNEIKVKVTDNKDNQRVYTLNITRGSSSESNNSSDVNLRNLEIDEGDLDFSEDKTTYNVNVDEDVSRIIVTAEPDDEEYLVKINGDEVNSGDDYKKKVTLSNGENTIKVVVEDEVENEKKTYKIIVNRGKVEESNSNNNNGHSNSSNQNNNSSNVNNNNNTSQGNNSSSVQENTDIPKGKGWTQVNGDWKYQNEQGNYLTKQWLLNKEDGVYYYLKEDGYRAKGWLQEGGNWYLLDKNGIMLTGWQYTGGAWYYLESSGAMRTGWLKVDKTVEVKNDSENKNTTEQNTNQSVNKADENNAENKKEENKVQTKVVTSWYYLEASGAMKTGWVKDNNKWYYMNKDGAMQTGWIIDNNSKYYLGNSGAMVTGTKTIKGKQYKFSTSGALIS